MDKNCCRENSNKTQEILDLRDFLKVISDTNRLKILCLLTAKELCVCEIFESLQLPQNLVSHHLKKLKGLSLVEERKEGTYILYRINQEMLKKYKNLFNQVIKN